MVVPIDILKGNGIRLIEITFEDGYGIHISRQSKQGRFQNVQLDGTHIDGSPAGSEPYKYSE